MDRTDRQRGARLLLACGIGCALLAITLLPVWVLAQPSDLPPRPPTPTPAPSAPEKSRSGARATELAGAWIELHCHVPAQGPSPFGSELWTAVQWKDSSGGWHNVEGWQGSLDEVASGVGKKVWWVAEKDLGTGPFRWLVRQTDGGEPLAVGEAFYLPRAAGETILLEVSVTP